MNIRILTEYSFLLVAVGTGLLAMAAGMVGSISVLKGQSLIGDAIGHASFPGIILAFMLSGEKHPVILLIGAVLSGILAFFLIQLVARDSLTSGDTAMAIILSSFFGLGMVLKSFIQGHSSFMKGQEALGNYIFGQAAYMLKEDLQIIFFCGLLSLLLFLLFYKEIKIHVFDTEYGKSIGIHKDAVSVLITLMTMLLIAAGLKAVGVILVCSMLITPGVIGLLWSKEYDRVLWIGAGAGFFSALTGSILSTLAQGMPTGPAIIVVLSLLAFVSFLLTSGKKVLIPDRERGTGNN